MYSRWGGRWCKWGQQSVKKDIIPSETWCRLFFFFFKFYFIFKLCKIVLVLPNIKMNPPQVYMCGPPWTLLPPPSLYHPSGSSQCTSPKHPVSCIEPGLATRFIHDILHVSMPFSQIFPPSPSPTESIRLFYTSVSLYHHLFNKCCHQACKNRVNTEWFSKVPVSCCGRCLYNVLLFSQVSSHTVHWESLQYPAAKENCSVPERNIPRQTWPVMYRHRRDQAASKPSKFERQNPSEGKYLRNEIKSTHDLLSPSSLKD